MKPVIKILLVLAILPNINAQEVDSSNYKIEMRSFFENFIGRSSLSKGLRQFNHAVILTISLMV